MKEVIAVSCFAVVWTDRHNLAHENTYNRIGPHVYRSDIWTGNTRVANNRKFTKISNTIFFCFVVGGNHMMRPLFLFFGHVLHMQRKTQTLLLAVLRKRQEVL